MDDGDPEGHPHLRTERFEGRTRGSVDDLVWSDASEQAAAIRSGSASAVELLGAYLDRIERFDPELRAFVAIDEGRARAEARAADEAVRRRLPEARRPFNGVTIAVKDVIDVERLATTHSCKALANRVAVADDPLVGRIRTAGFVVLGKTNVPEFCSGMTSSELNGTCRNPWSFDRTPAGSSGGAAVAVSAGLCAVAHGTDGAGSVRVPAAFCGLVGLKPSRGRVGFGPETGNPYYSTTVPGVLSRSVRDAAAVLTIYANEEPGADGSRSIADVDPAPLRIGVTAQAPFGEVDAECAEAAFAAAELLESLGHFVITTTPEWSTILSAAAGPMSVPGPAADVGLDQLDQVEPRNRPLLERAHRLSVVEHSQWVDLVRERSREFLELWREIDVLVTPTCGMLPPSVDWAPWDLSPEEHLERFITFPNFAQPFNLTGQPAISLPLAWSVEGLPIGVQLVGRRFEEPTILALAAQLEANLPWCDRRPAAVL